MISSLQKLTRKLGIYELSEENNTSVVRCAFCIAGVAMLLRIVFWLVANRYWEDALITCLHSENFAAGLGMTHYRPGESPLHGFTSPLSVLVPLVGDLFRIGFGIEFLKLVSIPASALTVLYITAIGLHRDIRLPAPLILMVAGYAAIEHHQILFGMAGMETQLSTLILVMSLYYMIAQRPVALGVSLGLCMLVRPDYAFWTVVVGVFNLFRAPRQLPRVVAIAVAVYLPWVLFTLLHYGSLVPNTIVAKGLGYSHWWDRTEVIDFATIKRHVWITLSEQLHVMLGPTFAGHGGGMHVFFGGPESIIGNLMFVFAAIGALAILLRRQWALWPLVGFVIVYSLYYVFLVPIIFSWYKVPYLLTLLLLSARGIQEVTEWFTLQAPPKRLQRAFACGYLALFAAVLPITFQTERQIQTHIENKIRKPAGLYLAEHMKEDEAVGCEPLGYMSYYSRGNVYDWPGLASRTVVAWSKEHPEERSLEGMLKGLEPEYLFLRDMEILYRFEDQAWFRERYHVVKTFLIDPEHVHQIRWIDRNVDTRFRIYKRKRPDDTLPYDESLWPDFVEYYLYNLGTLMPNRYFE